MQQQRQHPLQQCTDEPKEVNGVSVCAFSQAHFKFMFQLQTIIMLFKWEISCVCMRFYIIIFPRRVISKHKYRILHCTCIVSVLFTLLSQTSYTFFICKHLLWSLSPSLFFSPISIYIHVWCNMRFALSDAFTSLSDFRVR